MKKIAILFLFISVLIIFTGCKKQKTEEEAALTQEPAETLETAQPQTFEELISGTQITDITVKDQTSFVNVEKSYQEIKDVDISDWIIYTNQNYGFSFFRLADYAVFEVTPGIITIGGGEGVGEFFSIEIADKNNNDFHDKRPLRTEKIAINGQEFTIEEFEDGGLRTIIYFTEKGQYEYKMEFIYPTGNDEYVDLFNKTMGTFRFF